jgi:nitroimidazol reductase NimA-like FMN-containing flavoprotein (pyridoxamine 5'-phosphate oxidase superfamily)
MFETKEDLEALQELIDRSYAAAGPHLKRIHDPARRATAQELAERLTGMRLLVLATVTADGRPITGPVDGIFHRGAWHFGSAADSMRFRHIRKRPQVSATHLPGEEFAVVVHGRAVPVDIRAPESKQLRENLLQIYVPRYGPEWEHDFLDARSSASGSDPPQYARIEADRMFAFRMPG